MRDEERELLARARPAVRADFVLLGSGTAAAPRAHRAPWLCIRPNPISTSERGSGLEARRRATQTGSRK